MNELRWSNQLCEPVIITYNRADALNKTLAAFAVLNDKGMRCHVLDNCSTDHTPAVVASWQALWPGLVYHRNSYNIGGNANILRALELSDSMYAWVIGDDDLWQMEHIESLMTILATQKADILRLGWLISEEYAGVWAEAADLFAAESFFFASISMISATIVRRSIMTSYLNWAYQNVAYSYAHLVACIKVFQQRPLVVYSLPAALTTHTPSHEPGYFIGDLEWYVGWFKTARFFQDKAQKKAFIAELVRYMIRPKQGKFAEFIWLLQVIMNAKAQGISQLAYLGELFIAGPGWRWRVLGLTVIYAVVPGRFARLLRRGYFYLQKKEWKELQYDQSRL